MTKDSGHNMVVSVCGALLAIVVAALFFDNRDDSAHEQQLDQTQPAKPTPPDRIQPQPNATDTGATTPVEGRRAPSPSFLQILDQAKRPVANADVWFFGEDEVLLSQTTSDAQGRAKRCDRPFWGMVAHKQGFAFACAEEGHSLTLRPLPQIKVTLWRTPPALLDDFTFSARLRYRPTGVPLLYGLKLHEQTGGAKATPIDKAFRTAGTGRVQFTLPLPVASDGILQVLGTHRQTGDTVVLANGEFENDTRSMSFDLARNSFAKQRSWLRAKIALPLKWTGSWRSYLTAFDSGLRTGRSLPSSYRRGNLSGQSTVEIHNSTLAIGKYWLNLSLEGSQGHGQLQLGPIAVKGATTTSLNLTGRAKVTITLRGVQGKVRPTVALRPRRWGTNHITVWTKANEIECFGVPAGLYDLTAASLTRACLPRPLTVRAGQDQHVTLQLKRSRFPTPKVQAAGPDHQHSTGGRRHTV